MSFFLRAAYQTVLKISKLMLTVLGHARVQIVVEACASEAGVRTVTQKAHEEAAALQQALLHIPSPESEFSMRSVASRLGGHLVEQVSQLMLSPNTIIMYWVYFRSLLSSQSSVSGQFLCPMSLSFPRNL